jgi:hypothetical protein
MAYDVDTFTQIGEKQPPCFPKKTNPPPLPLPCAQDPMSLETNRIQVGPICHAEQNIWSLFGDHAWAPHFNHAKLGEKANVKPRTWLCEEARCAWLTRICVASADHWNAALCMATHLGSNVLFCMPCMTACVLFISFLPWVQWPTLCVISSLVDTRSLLPRLNIYLNA